MPAATWIAHVKSVYGMTYKQAMQRAAKTWKKKKSGPARKSRGKRKSKAKEPEEDEAQAQAQARPGRPGKIN